MKYIKRTLEKKIIEISKEYSCLLLIGPRQVSKSTMLEHLMEGTNRSKVSLDDMQERKLAQSDPALFLELHPAPVLIDEVQYAPELFSYIKINVDSGAAPGSYWLTGSQSFRLMDLAQESLAGRTAILHLSALSQSELYGSGETTPFAVDLQSLNNRKEGRRQPKCMSESGTALCPVTVAADIPIGMFSTAPMSRATSIAMFRI